MRKGLLTEKLFISLLKFKKLKIKICERNLGRESRNGFCEEERMTVDEALV